MFNLNRLIAILSLLLLLSSCKFFDSIPDFVYQDFYEEMPVLESVSNIDASQILNISVTDEYLILVEEMNSLFVISIIDSDFDIEHVVTFEGTNAKDIINYKFVVVDNKLYSFFASKTSFEIVEVDLDTMERRTILDSKTLVLEEEIVF